MNTRITTSNDDLDTLNDRVTAGVRAHRVKIRVLTGAAFLFGFVAVAASVLFVLSYLVLYLPKQKQILHDAETIAQTPRAGAGAREESAKAAVERIDKFLGVQITLTHVISMGTTVIAIMVGILGLGTLVLVSVVVLNRRVALDQIKVSLAQISSQLRELQTHRSPKPPGA